MVLQMQNEWKLLGGKRMENVGFGYKNNNNFRRYMWHRLPISETCSYQPTVQLCPVLLLDLFRDLDAKTDRWPF